MPRSRSRSRQDPQQQVATATCDARPVAGLLTLNYADDELMSLDLEAGFEIASRYVLTGRLGEGGMGTVWAAEDSESGGMVALKFMKGSVVSPDQQRRFMREARAAAAVDHAAVVKVLDVVELEDGSPVIVMEHLDGESLGDRLARKGRLSLAETATIMQTVVSAVGTAHAVGIVHRDLKPENIFLAKRDDDGGEDVKVLDFGIAKLTALDGEASQSTSLTGSGTILGTPHYMAIEQMFGEKDIDHRADIWAIGVMLYQALSGMLPTKADNVGQVLKLVLTRGIPPLDRVAPELPEEICQAVDAMMSRQREERPEDLRAIHALLKSHSGAQTQGFGKAVTLPPSSRRVEASTGGDETASTIDPFSDTAVAQPSPTSRRPLALALAALVVVALVGLGLTQSAEPLVAQATAAAVAASLGSASLAEPAPEPSASAPTRPTAEPTATASSSPSESASDRSPAAPPSQASQPSRPPVAASSQTRPPATPPTTATATAAPPATAAPSALKPQTW